MCVCARLNEIHKIQVNIRLEYYGLYKGSQSSLVVVNKLLIINLRGNLFHDICRARLHTRLRDCLEWDFIFQFNLRLTYLMKWQ